MAYLLLVLTVLFWAGNFVLARSMSDMLPPITMASLRWTLAFLILLPFVWPRLRKNGSLLLQNWPLILLLSLTGVAGFNTFVYTGVQTTTATNAALLQSAVPIMVLLLSVIFFREKASTKQVLGIILSLTGGLTLIGKGQVSNLLSLQLNKGDLWILAAVFSWTIYSISLRFKPVTIDGLTLLGSSMLVANIALYPLVYWELSVTPIKLTQFSSDVVLSVFYFAIFPSLLSYLFWNRGVAELGAAKASLFIHLMPVFGMILSAIFLAEKPQSFHLIGIGLIFCGIYLAVVNRLFKKKSDT